MLYPSLTSLLLRDHLDIVGATGLRSIGIFSWTITLLWLHNLKTINCVQFTFRSYLTTVVVCTRLWFVDSIAVYNAAACLCNRFSRPGSAVGTTLCVCVCVPAQ